MLKDGIALVDQYYDLSSQDKLLINLPMGKEVGVSGAMDGSMDVMLCVVRAWMDDFEFVERCRSDDFKTVRLKRLNEINAVIATLPELRRLYSGRSDR